MIGVKGSKSSTINYHIQGTLAEKEAPVSLAS